MAAGSNLEVIDVPNAVSKKFLSKKLTRHETYSPRNLLAEPALEHKCCIVAAEAEGARQDDADMLPNSKL